MIDGGKLKPKFIEIFGGEPRLFRAPGRVNLIGEHTDYNDGFVLPMAIERETVVAARLREDRKIRVHAVNLSESAEFDLDAPPQIKKGFWLNYVEGTARILERRINSNDSSLSPEIKLSGADLLIESDIPSGAGLSSSAALEVAVGLALSEISGNTVLPATLALVGQAAEHEFVGAKVGIMDQFVSANARRNHALLLDCRNLQFENVRLNLEKFAVVIINTGVKHDIATTAYNTRRAECEQGVEILREFLPHITHLRDVTPTQFAELEHNLPDPVRRRCRHIITEIERTTRAAKHLENNDLIEFGTLMWESHASLRDDYEVSCLELDLLVKIAGTHNEVAGARMTGGGFGGSTVNLIERENLIEITDEIAAEYQRETGIEPTVLISEAADGASEMIL